MADQESAPMDPNAAYPPPQNPAYPQPDAPLADYPAQPPPMAAEYPPPQPGYPPQQPGYPPQQPPPVVYPPQNPGYPPQQAYPPQPQAGYPPPSYPTQTQQQTTNNTTVVLAQPAAVALPTPVFRDHPVVVVDSNGQQVQTVLRYRAGCLTWLICCLICWVTGGCWIIALIPCCINATKDVVHITPTDGRIVGVYKRL